ncbi:Uncharacterized protein Rs2_51578 [Raphanus sativus]|nr:Uncharacterized protein Rs2_51578 [Raphanus sativus]
MRANCIYVSKKCGDVNVTGVAMYRVRAEISFYDNGEKATFLLLGNAGPELIGWQASELFDNNYEVMAAGANHGMLTPQSVLPETVVETAHAPGAVQVCNTAIGGTCSTWSLAEPSASSKESDMQKKVKHEVSLNQTQSTNQTMVA